MSKKIILKIPDNLTDAEESLLVSKKLAQKALSSSGVNKEVKRLGQEYTFKDTSYTIEVQRVPTEKPIEMLNCSVCSCEYPSNYKFYYYHNYGGSAKKQAVCSKECVDYMVDNFTDGRVAKTRGKLKPFRFR